MNQELALRTLSVVMKWDDERARREFAWLRLMSRLKYDGYQDFLAGVRFVESLAKWLQQFSDTERETAYQFIRTKLVYIGPSEMQRLVEAFYPRTVQEHLVRRVARALGVAKYRVWAHPEGPAAFQRLQRKTLFMGLSDGARIDILRHSNVGYITNEQAALTIQISPDKWRDLLTKLRRDLQDDTAKFEVVYLVDDFAGTGTSFLRFDEVKKSWAGKLLRFSDSMKELAESPFAAGWELCVHHYIATSKAAADTRERIEEARSTLLQGLDVGAVECSFGTVLPPDLPIDATPPDNAAFIALTQKYYDPHLQNEHTDVGGVSHMGLGYGGCALPIVLDHNTPNNSIALLWAETDGQGKDGSPAGHAMRPLFRRRQRHG